MNVTSKFLFIMEDPLLIHCQLCNLFVFQFFSGRASVRSNGSRRGSSGWSRVLVAVRSSFGKTAGKVVKLI